jgi:LysR family transcriptional activator of nhaA
MSFSARRLSKELQGAFPSAFTAPMLIQGPQSSVRQQLDHWLNKHHLQPRIVREFDDSALMNAFGREGGVSSRHRSGARDPSPVWGGSHW